MGGHGTWFLGATYPGNWAGIAPCSGYPTLKEYGSADGKIPDSSRNNFEQLLLRAGNQSDVLKLVNNYKPLGRLYPSWRFRQDSVSELCKTNEKSIVVLSQRF
jgi:hypothetical protein